MTGAKLKFLKMEVVHIKADARAIPVFNADEGENTAVAHDRHRLNDSGG